jgi:hypothetical protein
MMHPWVADGGDGFQTLRIAVNILKKQSQTANMGWSSSLGLGKGLKDPHHKNQLVTKCYTVFMDRLFGMT